MRELDLAARMAEASCRYLLWQQDLACGQLKRAHRLALEDIRSLSRLKADFRALWPARNKGTPANCSAFLDWRIRDYRGQRLHYTPSQARRG